MRYDEVNLDEFPESEAALRMLSRITPIYDNSYVMKWLMEVIGRELDNMGYAAQSLIFQRFPETATWGLCYLEQKYDLDSGEGLSTEVRRSRVISARARKKSMTPARLESILAEATGKEVTVEEFCSEYRFTVTIGGAAATDYAAIEEIIKRVKPSHLSYIVIISLSANSNIYMGGYTRRLVSHIVDCEEPDVEYLADENGIVLTDENGVILTL